MYKFVFTETVYPKNLKPVISQYKEILDSKSREDQEYFANIIDFYNSMEQGYSVFEKFHLINDTLYRMKGFYRSEDSHKIKRNKMLMDTLDGIVEDRKEFVLDVWHSQFGFKPKKCYSKKHIVYPCIYEKACKLCKTCDCTEMSPDELVRCKLCKELFYPHFVRDDKLCRYCVFKV